MKSSSVDAELASESTAKFILWRALSLLLTFYLSYLVVHFFFLNELADEATLMIIMKVWAGHMLLNFFALSITQNRTFGDLVFRIKYQSIRKNIGQGYLILIRSTITLTLFYITIYCNSLTGFSSYSIIVSLIMAVALSWHFFTINGSKLSLIDRATRVIAVKS